MDISGLHAADDQTRKLNKIISVLMEQCERGIDSQGGAYSLFQTAILLEDKVRDRTRSLEHALNELEKTNEKLVLAKEQTEAAQVRLMEAIENISEGFVHFDAEDRLVLCNSKFVEFWPGISSVVRPGISFAELSRWTAEQELVATIDVPIEEWLRKRLDRHRNPTEPLVVGLKTGRWLQIRERSTRDGGTVSIYTDISEIKVWEERRREQELAEKSILLQATLDNIVQGLSVFDKHLELVAWNDRFIDLLELPDWLVRPGARFSEFLQYRAERGDYGRDANAAIAIRMEMALQGRPLQMEQTLANGTVIELRRDPMPCGGFVATYTDITERKEAAEQLREAKESLERRVVERTAELTKVNAKLRQEISERVRMEEALRQATAEAEQANLSKTTFIAAASHDLLQPLNAARLFVSALSERALAEKETEYVERIDGALGSVEALLGTILDISKFDAGAVVVEKINFRAATLLESLTQEFTPLADEASVTFRVIPSSAIIYTDPALLARILRNFVSNGLRYTLGGRVVLGCRRHGPSIRFEVWDNGPGIPDDCIAEIFQDFRQLNGNQSALGQGCGLGLAIVQRIAKTLGH
ncbi:MAG: PAS-domain containing protein [Hyphomicrobiales bacterium]|nr:PAS-domain containing protein [Hyphomicrobiales bacterium]